MSKQDLLADIFTTEALFSTIIGYKKAFVTDRYKNKPEVQCCKALLLGSTASDP